VSTGDALTATRRVVDGSVDALNAAKQRINDLNVYPVPDGDTGTNLAATLDAVQRALHATPGPEPGVASVCQAVRRAALMGARGNSGIILSQIIRGFCDAAEHADSVTTGLLANAFAQASDTAYRAVRQPVEGTILTVIREIAAAAEDHRAGTIDELLDACLRRGVDAVEETPRLLETLRDAGVVDAGGAGLVEILQGAITGLRGQPARTSQPAVAVARPIGDNAHEPSRFRYCTNLVVVGVAPSLLERDLEPLGDCLIVVGDAAACRVHVHADDPGRVISIATAAGALASVDIADMHTQIAERDARLAPRPPLRLVTDEHRRCDVVAVIAGDGNARIAESLGARGIVVGGATMNPSTQEILAAVDARSADSVVILPNNPNVVLAARAAAAAASRPCEVVETRSIPAGLSALVAYQPDRDAADNAGLMRNTLRGVASGELTRAVRDARVDGIDVRAGDWIGLVDGRAAAACASLDDAISQVAGVLVGDARSLVTVLVGSGQDAELARRGVERWAANHGDVDVEIHDGGQPHYPLLIAAE
jgi:uncharacterized protein